MLVTRGKICIAQAIIPKEKEVQEPVYYICYCSELTKKTKKETWFRSYFNGYDDFTILTKMI